jgi:hypothetical protein
MKPKLIASALDISEIISLIERYWYAKPDAIVLFKLDSRTWSVYQNEKEMLGFRVKQKGNRFRFEHKGDVE